MAWVYWNPDKNIFILPFLNRPIAWYGLFFVLGLILSYLIVLKLVKEHLEDKNLYVTDDKIQESTSLTDKLTWFVVAGIIIGARLGHVIFYDWPYYSKHLMDIPKVWEGGLASHGGAIGIVLAIMLFRFLYKSKYPSFSFLNILDIVAVPTALTGAFIRIGNFFNQEITGVPTDKPWGVIFGEPADGSAVVPRHAVQLYEAFFYLIIFLIIWFTYKRTSIRKYPGFTTGLLLLLIFTARFFIEFYKSPQSHVMNETFIQMGQLLSLPFIALGIILIYLSKRFREA